MQETNILRFLCSLLQSTQFTPSLCSRYRNGRRLAEETLGMRSNLFILDVSGAQGVYTCKATNDYGSEISYPAELKIKGKICLLTKFLVSMATVGMR